MRAWAGRPGRPEDRQVRPPRTDRLPVLPCHYPNDLPHVAQVVGHPGREVLLHCHYAELRMAPAPQQVGVGQPQCDQSMQALPPQLAECIEQVTERVTARRGEHRLAIKLGKGNDVAVLKHVLDARHPVRAFAVNQVPDHIERAPGHRSLRCGGPAVREIAKQVTEDRRSALKHGQRITQSKVHVAPPRGSLSDRLSPGIYI